MQRRDQYPNDSVTGGCFVTGDYDPTGGVIDLDIFVDSMPPWGRLCLSPKAVRDMVTTLGWTTLADSQLVAEYEALVVANEKLVEENRRMRAAVAHIVRTVELGRIDHSWLPEPEMSTT